MAGAAWMLGALGRRAPQVAGQLWDVAGRQASATAGPFAGVGLVATSDGWAWSHTPLPVGIYPDRARLRLDAATLRSTPGGRQLRTGVSGTQGIFWSERPDAVAVASEPGWLATRGMRPDWDAWAQILGFGGPLGARTPWEGVRRLRADEALVVDETGGWSLQDRSWEFRDGAPEGTGDLTDVAAALEAAVERIPAPMKVTLSGGWDSRMLAVLAASRDPGTTAWTTSKDNGLIQEELIARAVARRLGIRHAIVTPRADAFEEDFLRYAGIVHHSSPFHVWAMELADRLAGHPGTVLDGFAGHSILGGALSHASLADADGPQPFSQHYRHIPAAGGVLDPRVEKQVRERCVDGYRRAIRTIEDHPEARTLSNFLCRSSPVISWSPFGVFANRSRVAAPYVDHDVVLTTFAVPRAQRADPGTRRDILAGWDPRLARLPTTAWPVASHRLRPCRVASTRTARACRSALLGGPVAGLVADPLRQGPLDTWRAMLASFPARHVLKGLWLLADWIRIHEPAGATPDVFLEPVG